MKVGSCKKFSIVGAVLLLMASVGGAFAADPPKWVAALYVEAQKVAGLRWNVVAGATEYRVLRKGSADPDFKQVGTTTAPQYLDKNLVPGETYRYVLRSVAAGAESANSEERSVVVPAEKKVEVLAAPVWDRIKTEQAETFGKVTMKVGMLWLKGGSNVIAYNVYRGPKAGGPYDLLTSVQENRYTDATVEDGKTYAYILRAIDSGFAESPASEERVVAVAKVAKAEEKKKEEKLKLIAKKAKILYEIRKVDPAGKWPLQYPLGVAASEDTLFVVVLGIKKVVAYNLENVEFKYVFPNDEDEFQLMAPSGIDIDSDGNLIVADTNRLVRFRPNGKYMTHETYPNFVYKDKSGNEISSKTGFVGVRSAKNGDIWAVDNNNSRVLHADEKGKVIEWVGEYGKMDMWGYGFAKPGGLSLTDKEVFITDMMNARVLRLSLEGKLLGEVGESGDAVGTFGSPRGNVIDAKGRLLVIDQKSATIQGFTPEGKYLFVISSFDPAKPLELGMPHDLVMDRKGRLAITEVLVDKAGGGLKIIELLED